MRVLWTAPAADAFEKLPRRLQQAILDRIAMISEFPEMYPVREHHPYAGLRYFLAGNYCLSYAVAEDTLIVLAVFPARTSGSRDS